MDEDLQYHHTNFNPRSPWGERLLLPRTLVLRFLFQSTLPVGGATWHSTVLLRSFAISIHAPRGGSDLKRRNYYGRHYHISIHAPRGGSDFPVSPLVTAPGNFNPRSPWGERLRRWTVSFVSVLFQSTLPVGGATFGRYSFASFS